MTFSNQKSEIRNQKSHYQHLDIVVPVYNEGANITRTLDEIAGKIKTPHRVTIVYDFDEDDTLPVVRQRMASQTNLILLKNTRGRGVLNAIRSGFDSVSQQGDDRVVLVVMGDLSDDLSNVDAMFAMMNEGCDVVCGSRYMPGGRQIGGPWLKRTMSRTAGLSLRYLARFPTHDATNSFKMYSTRLLRSVTMESTGGFEIGLEIVVKAHLAGLKIGELPTTWSDRAAGQSRFQLWKWLPRYLHWYKKAMWGAFFGKRSTA